MDTTKVVLCVCTCKRPVWLRRLLDAVAELDFEGHLSVVVVDNDAEGAEGLAVCQHLAAHYRWPLTCSVEDRRGIPFARNRAVITALEQDADFIAMLDDDERPSRNWLRELLRVQSETDADVIAGPVFPEFTSTTPPWLVEGRFFVKGDRRSDRSQIHVHSTCNFMAKSCCFRELLPAPFDVEWGLTGNDDAAFFQQLAARKHKMYWSAQARVFETIPASRANLRWLMQRQFRMGSAQIKLKRTTKRGVRGELNLIAGTVWFIGTGTARYLMFWSDYAYRARGILRMCRGIGRIAGYFGMQYSEYKKIHGV